MAEGEKTEEKPAKEGRAFKLRKAIQAHGEQVEELFVREPTTMDILRFGNPVMIRPVNDGGLTAVADPERMTAMMVDLAAVPQSSITKMHPRDWATISTWLTSFFVPDWDQLGA